MKLSRREYDYARLIIIVAIISVSKMDWPVNARLLSIFYKIITARVIDYPVYIYATSKYNESNYYYYLHVN